MTTKTSKRKCTCGKEMTPCPTGWVCETCNGKIQPYEPNERHWKPDDSNLCTACDGTGEVDCDCEDGMDICPHCGQDMDCEECAGTGMAECWKCDGSGLLDDDQ